MWRLDKDIATAIETERRPGLQFRNKIRSYMYVTAAYQAHRNLRGVQFGLEPVDSTTDIRTRIVVNAWKNVRGASDDRHPIGDRHTGHFEGLFQIPGAVVDSRKQVAMEVYQNISPMLCIPPLWWALQD